MSDVGLTRAHNEDSFRCDPKLQIYVVADGMGGHSHGEVASRIAVDTVVEFIERSSDGDVTWPSGYDPDLDRNANRLHAAIRVAHERVLRAIDGDAALSGMGTTLVGCVVADSKAVLAHVGDSRAYRMRDGALEQLTEDHTWVHEQVLAGFLSAEQARNHPLKNVVTRALGGETDVEIEVQEIDLRAGDRLLLCSDGLTTMLSDAEIAERLGAKLPHEWICRNLIDDANSKGGLDNVTVLLIAVEA
jgi:protein phosphatase